ncbi:hypothetical protein MANES_03G151900v8 [Manihot esculenta]|uniref:Uncharacterized protein n=2 Tax=Manihot esculenta TaxID=3983 RepID=A0A2C9W7Q7_MANES|nr:hypothetical protein MANES_03G151900v8 [Manihot esculenta]
MANEDSVTISINKKVIDESPILSNCYIFKVPKELKSVNEEAYEPQLIAIGPYHHGKNHLLAMENHKIQYLQSFLKRSAQDISRYVQIIRNLEERARKCYTEPLSFTSDEFIEMMLIDGCFLIELMCKITWENDSILFEDPILGFDHMLIRLRLDLLLVENQLPFFILGELLVTSNLIPNLESRFSGVMEEVWTYKGFLPRPARLYRSIQLTEIKHLLELEHGNYQPSPERIEVYEKKRTKNGRITRCAIELREAGIKFKSIETHNLFAISFVNGVIEIPKIEITDFTECVLRNLVAYEQLPFGSPKYFSEYVGIMNSLIDSAKDVELLCRKGIIDNWMGDDETVAILFNNLGKHVFYERALYPDIVNNVNEHYKKRSNLWMAKLRHDYFQSP